MMNEVVKVISTSVNLISNVNHLYVFVKSLLINGISLYIALSYHTRVRTLWLTA